MFVAETHNGTESGAIFVAQKSNISHLLDSDKRASILPSGLAPSVVCLSNHNRQDGRFFVCQLEGEMIYFITDGEYVKIGWTDKDDTQERLDQLQTGNARQLSVLGVIEGDRSAEILLHKILNGLRVRGEWFKVTSETIPLPVFVCSACGSEFGTVKGLAGHKGHCKPKFTCSICGSSFDSAKAKAGHTGHCRAKINKAANKPFVCSGCSAAFESAKGLAGHTGHCKERTADKLAIKQPEQNGTGAQQ